MKFRLQNEWTASTPETPLRALYPLREEAQALPAKVACFGVGGGENEAKRMRGTTSLQAKLLRPARRQNAFLNFSLKYAHMQNRGKEQMEK